VAALAALSMATPALLALSVSPASAATGSGALLCPNTLLTTQVAPFPISVTAGPTGPKAPTGASIAVAAATVTLTVPGPVVGGFKAQANANNVSLSGATIKLDATHATGALSATVSAPSQPITNYNATGGPGGIPTADAITFVANGVDFGSLTTAGVNGQSVDISLAANSSTDLITLGIDGILPSLSFNNCTNDTAGVNVAWLPSIASVGLVGSPPPPPPTTHTFKNTAKPKVLGTPKVGKTLTCKPGSWSPAPTRSTFQWLRDGKAVKKAVKAKHKVVKADVRHRLSCRVTVTAPGYTRATATSTTTKRVRR